jgi:hypothetical protein
MDRLPRCVEGGREASNPVASISGNLKGSAIESAGIQVFDKGVKTAAE